VFDALDIDNPLGAIQADPTLIFLIDCAQKRPRWGSQAAVFRRNREKVLILQPNGAAAAIRKREWRDPAHSSLPLPPAGFCRKSDASGPDRGVQA